VRSCESAKAGDSACKELQTEQADSKEATQHYEALSSGRDTPIQLFNYSERKRRPSLSFLNFVSLARSRFESTMELAGECFPIL
jgi:hypothetical protein